MERFNGLLRSIECESLARRNEVAVGSPPALGCMLHVSPRCATVLARRTLDVGVGVGVGVAWCITLAGGIELGFGSRIGGFVRVETGMSAREECGDGMAGGVDTAKQRKSRDGERADRPSRKRIADKSIPWRGRDGRELSWGELTG